MRTRVKICGIRTIEHALAAVAAGADAIGLMFYEKSSRAITLEQALAISAVLPPFVTSVGVFVNPQKEEVEAVLQALPQLILQFHGEETEPFCLSFHRPYIKAVPVSKELDVLAYCADYPCAQGFLFDTASTGFGGSGEVFDWSLIPKNLTRPIILAGGLNFENIATAIKTVKPFAVDVSGGVESSKGIKDTGKIQKFIQEVQHVTL